MGFNLTNMALKDRAVSFVVPGDPTPWMRPRADSRGKFVRIFNHKKHDKYLAIIRTWANAAMKGYGPMADPCAVTVVAHLGMPKSWPLYKKRAARAGRIPCMDPKDCDNIAKIVCDGMNGVVYEDDRQIVRLVVEKEWSDNPCVIVRVTPLDFSKGGRDV